MEEFKDLDFFDESTNLFFHKLNPKKFGPDEHFYSTLNSWDSPNIQEFLSTPLGNSMRPEDDHADHYIIQNNEMEVVGSTRIIPQSVVVGNLDLLYYSNIYKGEIKPHFIPLETAHKLLTKGASGLYIASFVSNPELTHNGYGTRIIEAITQNATILNRNIQPFCTMAMVRRENAFSRNIFEKNGYKTTPVCYEGYDKYYLLNSQEL